MRHTVARGCRGSLRAMRGPAGHYYSPLPSREGVQAHSERPAARPRQLPGIALNEEGQLALLKRLESYYGELPFPRDKSPGRRYFFENPMYSYSDAICLYAMIRHVRPRRIIEVGSGYSSCVTLDANELFFGNEIVCTFIEPYPQLLQSLLKPGDRGRIEIIAPRWTPENRPVVDGSNPASGRAPQARVFYSGPGRECKPPEAGGELKAACRGDVRIGPAARSWLLGPLRRSPSSGRRLTRRSGRCGAACASSEARRSGRGRGGGAGRGER